MFESIYLTLPAGWILLSRKNLQISCFYGDILQGQRGDYPFCSSSAFLNFLVFFCCRNYFCSYVRIDRCLPQNEQSGSFWCKMIASTSKLLKTMLCCPARRNFCLRHTVHSKSNLTESSKFSMKSKKGAQKLLSPRNCALFASWLCRITGTQEQKMFPLLPVIECELSQVCRVQRS